MKLLQPSQRISPTGPKSKQSKTHIPDIPAGINARIRAPRRSLWLAYGSNSVAEQHIAQSIFILVNVGK
jgi:hypothetical protein